MRKLDFSLLKFVYHDKYLLRVGLSRRRRMVVSLEADHRHGMNVSVD
jgi:hypothetical protein